MVKNENRLLAEIRKKLGGRGYNYRNPEPNLVILGDIVSLIGTGSGGGSAVDPTILAQAKAYTDAAIAALKGSGTGIDYDTLRELQSRIEEQQKYTDLQISKVKLEAERYTDDAIAALPETDLTSYATINYVDNEIAKLPAVDVSKVYVDVQDEATLIDAKTYTDAEIAKIPPVDLTGLATEEDLAAINSAGSLGVLDLPSTDDQYIITKDGLEVLPAVAAMDTFHIGTLAERDTYDSAQKGFLYFCTDIIFNTPEDKFFNGLGDSTTTTFTLPFEPKNKQALMVSVGNVLQTPFKYSLVGSELTFTTAPFTGAVINVWQMDIRQGISSIYVKQSALDGDWSESLPVSSI